jgi:subtilisin family serine protease
MLWNLVRRLRAGTENINRLLLPGSMEDFIAEETSQVSFDLLWNKKAKKSSFSVEKIDLLTVDSDDSATSDRHTQKTGVKTDFTTINREILDRNIAPISKGEINQEMVSQPEQDVRITQLGKVKSESPEETSSDRFTSGVFVVGESGEVGFDFLFDGGKHRSELAIFSLEGMEAFEFGSTAFIEEASRRALTGSQWGHVVIRDRTEGAKFDGKLEHKNWNKGEYQGVKTFEMNAGDRFGVMLIPNGTVKQVHQKPNSKGAKKPLFSLATEDNNFGQIADLNGKGHTFAMEDVNPGHQWFDRDYNDIIFQVSGATAETQSLDNAINPEKDWRGTDVGQEIIQYIEENDPNSPKLPIDPETGSPYKPGELLIKFSANTSNADIQKLANDYGAIAFENLVPFDPNSDSSLQQWRLFRFDPNLDLLPIREAISGENGIDAIELNTLLSSSAWIPNDSQFQDLWGLNNTGQDFPEQGQGIVDADINAPEAWEIQRGSKDVVVAIIDTGVYYTHEDLQDNMWKNVGEIANNGIDDDGNGYIDDFDGYDFGNQNGDPNPDLLPLYDIGYEHGTHVAGIIGAVGNNSLGVVGVSPNVSLMALNARDLGVRHLTTSAIVQSFNYATNNGANIINASFGSFHYQDLMYDALQDVSDAGVLVVAAAGNEDGSNKSLDNDIDALYPSSYGFSNIISVAATNNQDELWEYSRYGGSSIDLAAPGVEIYSTIPGESFGGWLQPYEYYSGTSMAAPHVAGAAALLLAENPNLTPEEIKQILLNTGDSLASLQGKTVSGKRLNLHKALEAVVQTQQDPVYKIGGEFQVNIDTTLGQFSPSIAALDDGGFLVTRMSYSQGGSDNTIYAQRYDNQSNPIGNEFQVNSYTDNQRASAKVTSLKDGGFLISWQSYGQNGRVDARYAQRYDNQSNPVGNEFQVNSHTNNWDSDLRPIALEDGGFLMTWDSLEQNSSWLGVYAQRYDNQNNRIGNEFQVSSYTDVWSNYSNGNGIGLEDGGFLLTWYSLNNAYVQRYDAYSNPIGSKIQIASSHTPVGLNLALLKNGSFLATWYSDSQNDTEIYAQRYDNHNNPVGNEFQINSYTDGNQLAPSVTALDDGGFLITWHSEEQDGSRVGVYAQRYDAQSNPVGNEFQVNSYTDYELVSSAITTLKDGNILISWISNGRYSHGFRVFTQRFGIAPVTPPTLQPAPPSPSVFQHFNQTYNSLQDSPFPEDAIQVETFEDGTLDTLGVTASTGSLAPASHSIEENGNSWQIDQENLTLTFDEDVLGVLPTRAGVAVTDIANVDIGTVAMEIFDPQGISLGVTQPEALGTGDRFFGVEYEGGISAITFTANRNDWNIDHLQYG